MKVLYAAYRHDPRARGPEVGADHAFLQALQSNGGDVPIVGPFTAPAVGLERLFKRLYKAVTGKNYLKYDFSNTLRASREVSRVAREYQPDVIFSLYPPPLAFYNGNIPCIFRTDATFLGSVRQSPEFQSYGAWALRTNVWLERRAIRKCARVITHSEWARQSLLNDYHLAPEKIVVYPNPSALPDAWIQPSADLPRARELDGTLRLLFIGRDPHRKGLDIALETVARLNQTGQPAHLSVCGVQAENQPFVTYFSNLRKSDDAEREKYLRLLQSSHLLIHPARFDPSPRVTAEAAAFGTPTLTNDTGGLSTSVRDGESGIVLPRNSPPEAYVQAIRDLVSQPERYYALCQSTRLRYERELNSAEASKRLSRILESVMSEYVVH